MKRIIKISVVPLIPFVAAGDCILWKLFKAKHQWEHTYRTSLGEVWGAWKRW